MKRKAACETMIEIAQKSHNECAVWAPSTKQKKKDRLLHVLKGALELAVKTFGRAQQTLDGLVESLCWCAGTVGTDAHDNFVFEGMRELVASEDDIFVGQQLPVPFP
jgi:hypothetical protein